MSHLIYQMFLGPYQSYNGVNRPGTNTTYSGTAYPQDWKNSIFGIEIVQAATEEVKGQLRILYFSIAATAFVLFVFVCIIFKDKPAQPANRASIKR